MRVKSRLGRKSLKTACWAFGSFLRMGNQQLYFRWIIDEFKLKNFYVELL